MESSQGSENVLLVERRTLKSGLVEIWTLNRPDKLNALNSTVLKRLDEEGLRLKSELAKDLMTVRALILTGSGAKAFVVGADISEMRDFSKAQAETFSRLGQQAFGRLEELPIPTVAALQGFTLGGGLELAMGCDVLVAPANAEFGQPESHLGLIPGFGATARFVDRLGPRKALELLYSGRRVKADEALRLGLIEHMVPDGMGTLDFALNLAEEMTLKAGPLAIAALKKIVHSKTHACYESTLDAEARAFGEIFITKDKQEGVGAFLEKRRPTFTGT